MKLHDSRLFHFQSFGSRGYTYASGRTRWFKIGQSLMVGNDILCSLDYKNSYSFFFFGQTYRGVAADFGRIKIHWLFLFFWTSSTTFHFYPCLYLAIFVRMLQFVSSIFIVKYKGLRVICASTLSFDSIFFC